jgi:hypothetical protein
MKPGQILEAFWVLAEGRCAFDLKNSTHLEGYILEVEDQHIVFGHGGPLGSEQEQRIPSARNDGAPQSLRCRAALPMSREPKH